MSTSNILIIGGNSVGKTSLLITMLSQLDLALDGTNLHYSIDSRTHQTIDSGKKELGRLFQFFDVLDERSLSAGLDTCQVHLSSDQGDSEDQEIVLSFKAITVAPNVAIDNEIKQANIIIIAVDSPALMETSSELFQQGRTFHESKNVPQELSSQIQEALNAADGHRLFLFVPTKCEKYLANSEARQALIQAVRHEYRDLFTCFFHKSRSQKTAAVIVPVETLGGFVFSRIEQQNKFRFAKVKYSAEYAPKYGDHVVRFILLFLLQQLGDQQKIGALMRLLEKEDSLSEISLGPHLLGDTTLFHEKKRAVHNLWLVGILASLVAALLNVVIYEFGNTLFNAFSQPRLVTVDEASIVVYESIFPATYVIIVTFLVGMFSVSMFSIFKKYIKARANLAFWLFSFLLFILGAIGVFFLPPPLSELRIQVGLLIMTILSGIAIIGLITMLAIEQ